MRMTLTVKRRIALIMAAVVVIGIINTSISWWTHSRAAEYGNDALAASETARLAAITTVRMTQFISDSRNVAFTAARSQTSEDLSVSYGRLMGSQAGVDAVLRGGTLEPYSHDVSIIDTWEDLRDLTYLWINREAAKSGVEFRMSLESDGRFRASTVSNLVEPPAVARMTDEELSREVRDRGELLLNNTLRKIANDAETSSTDAAAAEEKARADAWVITLALSLIALLVAVVAATWLYRSIAIPLEHARVFADDVTEGNLGATFAHHRDDEIGAVTHAIETMKDTVVNRIATMQEMAGVVLVTAEDLRSAADTPAVKEKAELLSILSAQMLEG